MVGVVIAWWQKLVVQCSSWRRLTSRNILYCYMLCQMLERTIQQLQLSWIFYIFSLQLSVQFNVSLGRVIFFSLFHLNLGCMLFYTWHRCHGLDHLLSTQMFQQNMNSGCKLLSRLWWNSHYIYSGNIYTQGSIHALLHKLYWPHKRCNPKRWEAALANILQLRWPILS